MSAQPPDGETAAQPHGREDGMRPLVSPVDEYRSFGAFQVLGGMLLTIIAAAVEKPVSLIGTAAAAAFYGTWMYLLAYRRSVRQAVREPAPAPTPDRERWTVTVRRTSLSAAALVAVLAAVGLLGHTVALVAGIAVGNGIAMQTTAQWLRRWERQHGQKLLREPRWRWRRDENGRRGRGILDPRDFYTAAPGEH